MSDEKQIQEEKEIVEQLGEDVFKKLDKNTVKMPKNMTATEYRKWRKAMINQTISENYGALKKLDD